MKKALLIQFVFFLAVFGSIGAAYVYYEPFTRLADDVISYSGITEKATQPLSIPAPPAQVAAKPAKKPVEQVSPGVSRTHVSTYPAYEDRPPSRHMTGAETLQRQPAASTGKSSGEDRLASRRMTGSDAPQTPPAAITGKSAGIPGAGTRVTGEVIAPKPDAQAGQASDSAEPHPEATMPPAGAVRQVPGDQRSISPGVAAPAVPSPVALPQATRPPTTNVSPARSSGPPASQAGVTPDSPPDSSGAQNTPTPEEQALAGLTAARQAWQNGKTEESIRRYQALIRQFPNHPDFAGELGNIYFTQGNYQMALDAYSEAFGRLMRMEDYDRARRVLEMIRRMDYKRASYLEKYFRR